jgi:hypothetical protein
LFADRGITSRDGFVKCENTSSYRIARVISTFVLIVTNLSLEIAKEFLGDFIIRASGFFTLVSWWAKFLAGFWFTFVSVRNYFT